MRPSTHKRIRDLAYERNCQLQEVICELIDKVSLLDCEVEEGLVTSTIRVTTGQLEKLRKARYLGITTAKLLELALDGGCIDN